MRPYCKPQGEASTNNCRTEKNRSVATPKPSAARRDALRPYVHLTATSVINPWHFAIDCHYDRWFIVLFTLLFLSAVAGTILSHLTTDFKCHYFCLWRGNRASQTRDCWMIYTSFMLGWIILIWPVNYGDLLRLQSIEENRNLIMMTKSSWVYDLLYLKNCLFKN